MKTEILDLDIEDIHISNRVRISAGDIDVLALSLQTKGQLEPIVVMTVPDGYDLLAGRRRLTALRKLGHTKVRAILYETLNEIDKLEYDLVTNLQRKNLTFIEEAKGIKRLVLLRKKNKTVAGLHNLFGSVKNKDLAEELQMTSQRFSECLRIAKALESNPDLVTECKTRGECLRRLRQEFLKRTVNVSITPTTPVELIQSLGEKSASLFVIYPEGYDPEILHEIVRKLTDFGQVLIFTDYKHISSWQEELKRLGFNFSEEPLMWVNGSKYVQFLWASKNLSAPFTPIPMVIMTPEMGDKMFAPKLIKIIIKACSTEKDTVVFPELYNADILSVCLTLDREVIAGRLELGE